MAQTLDSYAPFDSGAGADVTESTWREFMQYMTGRSVPASSGVLRGIDQQFEVFADSTGMQVKVRTGQGWIKGHWGRNSSEKILPIAANGSGNPRKDRVLLRCDFVDNLFELDVRTGTPHVTTPTVPNLAQTSTEWEISLGVVDVPAGDTSIDASQVRDARTWVENPDPTAWLTADQTKNENTTLADLTDLTIPVSSNALYSFEASLEYSSSTTADVKLALVGATGAFGRYGGVVPNASLAFSLDSVAVGSNLVVGGVGVGTKEMIYLHGWFAAPEAAAGGGLNVAKLQWAQNTSDATNTQLHLGSWMRIKRL